MGFDLDLKSHLNHYLELTQGTVSKTFLSVMFILSQTGFALLCTIRGKIDQFSSENSA